MTAREFKIWMMARGFSISDAAVALGVSIDTVKVYRANGVPGRNALLVRLACAALAAGLSPYAVATKA